MPEATFTIQQIRCNQNWTSIINMEEIAVVWKKEAKIELDLRQNRSIRRNGLFFLRNYDRLVAPQEVVPHIRSLSMFRAKLIFLILSQKEGIRLMSNMEPLRMEECTARECRLYGDFMECQAKYIMDKVLPRFIEHTDGWNFVKEMVRQNYKKCSTFYQYARVLAAKGGLSFYNLTSETNLEIVNFLIDDTYPEANDAIIDPDNFDEDEVFDSIFQNAVGWRNEFLCELQMVVGDMVRTEWTEVLISARASVVRRSTLRSWILSGNGTPSQGIVQEHDLLVIFKAMILEIQDDEQEPFVLQAFQPSPTRSRTSISQSRRQRSRPSRPVIRRRSRPSTSFVPPAVQAFRSIRPAIHPIRPAIHQRYQLLSMPGIQQGFHLSRPVIQRGFHLSRPVIQRGSSHPCTSFSLPEVQQGSLPLTGPGTSFSLPEVQQGSLPLTGPGTSFSLPEVQQGSLPLTGPGTSFSLPEVQQGSLPLTGPGTSFSLPEVQQGSLPLTGPGTSFSLPEVQQGSLPLTGPDTSFSLPTVFDAPSEDQEMVDFSTLSFWTDRTPEETSSEESSDVDLMS